MEEKILEELKNINKKIDKVQENLRKEMYEGQEKLKKELREEFNEKIDKQTEILLDRQYLFEQDYGRKIDAIYDSVSMEMDKNIEKSNKIRKLEKRMDKNEIKLFNFEERISILEGCKNKK